MVAENQNPAHIFWQQRVDKERKALNKHLYSQYRKHGMGMPASAAEPYDALHVPPAHELPRTQSTPSFLPAIHEHAAREATPSLREDWRPLSRYEDLATAGSPDARGALRSSGGRSLRSSSSRAPGSRGQRVPTSSSQRSSVRSSLTSLTTASLRREVAEAVQQEVAKVVQPLKDKLHTEQSTRQRLEEMLKQASNAEAGT